MLTAYHLPAWAPAPNGLRAISLGGAPGPGGALEPALEVRCPDTDPVWIAGLAAGLRTRTAAPMDPLDRAARLGAVGRRFLDRSDPVRREALELLPTTSGLAPAMAEAVLDGMAADWTPERLSRLLREELGDPVPLGSLVDRGDRSVMAAGPRLCVQLVAGSVPGVGVTALLRSLLLGSPTLLKPGLGDVVLPVLFARALAELDPDLSELLAVVYWPGGDTAMEDAAIAKADAVVVYGSDATVASMRTRAPALARFVGYHHREGVGVVGAGVLGSDREAAPCARDVARAVAFFDQRGCVSPRVVYVEDVGTAVTPVAFAGLLADALEALEQTLPGGALERFERSGLHQLRGTAEMLSGGDGDRGAAAWVRHGGPAPWTVVFDPHGALESNCVGRAVIVRPFQTVGELADRLRPSGPHLQTVGVAGLGDRLKEVAESMGRLGASRVTSFAEVPFPRPWWHHDGRGPLADLVRWVELDRGGVEADGA